MEKGNKTLRFIFPVFRIFYLPGYNYKRLFLLLKHELKPNCFDNRNAEIFPESIYQKPRGIMVDWGLKEF